MPDKQTWRRIGYSTFTLVAAACLFFAAKQPTIPYKLANEHLANASFSKPVYEANFIRENLDCGRNLTIKDLCNPCGVSCNQETCDNWKCAIACADKDFENRITGGFNTTKSIYFRYNQTRGQFKANTSGKA